MTTYPPPPSEHGSGGGASGPRASFGRRLGALLLDALVLVVAAAILAGILAAAFGSGATAFVVILYFVVFIAYEIYFHGRPSGQTLGKKWLGIRVVDFNTGGPIGYGRATLRMIGRYISGIPCYLGYLWMLWDNEKQCWHDKMANDVVVPTEHYPVP